MSLRKAFNPQRRRVMVQTLALAGVVSLSSDALHAASALLVKNVTQLYSVRVAGVLRPKSTAAVVTALTRYAGRVAVGGGRFSMGGHVAIQDGLHIDMRGMNQVVWFRPHDKVIRVQAGMTWRDIQDMIDPHHLSIQTMQSYANFTVGGSVSVNAHGRYVGHGSIANSIRAAQLVLADGRILEVSKTQNYEVLRCVIGGYGAMGVITEVELQLDDNQKIARDVDYPALSEYVDFFKQNIKNDPNALMHNADLAPPLFNRPVSVTWRVSGADLTEAERLTPRGQSYDLEQTLILALTESPQYSAEKIRRKVIEPMTLKSDIVQWRNREASLDVAQLEPRTRHMSTYVLQEYFIPVPHFMSFVQGMTAILQQYDANVLNVSIRHSPADTIAMLPWAKEEVFSFVLFYKQRTYPAALKEVGVWTRALIDLALVNGGRYYLPYQLHATQTQFELSYPEYKALQAVKKRLDASGRLINTFWDKYGD